MRNTSAEAGGLKFLHVPYRGGAPAIADVAAGQIDMFFANVSEIVGQIKSGQVLAQGNRVKDWVTSR